jgi:uncharacterized protein with NRDE domain
MCTIIVLNQVHPTYPVIIAANRDEYYARPSTPPTRLSDAPVAIGGVDGRKKGTWMGATAGGLFVGLTNQRTYSLPHNERASRGQVVLDCLQAETVDGVDALLGAMDPRAYNAFNLLYADARRVRTAYAWEADRVEFEDVPVGIHVLPNDRLDHPDWFKVGRAQSLLRGWETKPWDVLAPRLERVLADREKAPWASVSRPPVASPFTRTIVHQLTCLCIRTPVYGTRSSTIVALDQAGAVAHYRFAAEAPDKAAFEDVTELLR